MNSVSRKIQDDMVEGLTCVTERLEELAITLRYAQYEETSEDIANKAITKAKKAIV